MLTAAALLPLLALSTPPPAQEVAVKAGINVATFLEDEPRADNRPGIVGGLSVHMPARQRFSLQLEALLSDKGTRFAHGDDRLRYLEGPVLGRIDFAEPDAATRPFALIGVAPAFRLSARATRNGPGEGTSGLDSIRAFDAGWVAGAGIEFGRLLLETRYTRGLRQIDEPDRHDHPARYNRVFSVMAGYLFW